MRDRLVGLAAAVVVLGGVVGFWHFYVAWSDVSPFLLPPPSDVWSATVELVRDPDTWRHGRATLWEIVAGFGLATAFGVVSGIAVGEVRILERALNPVLVALQVLPKIAIIPLLILWLGFGSSTKIVVAATFAFFPVTAATRSGIRSVERGHRDLAATLRTRWWQRLVHIDLPSALPSILTGMEVGIVLATVGAVVAEYLAGSEGLGWLAVAYLNQLQVDSLFGVILLLCVLGFVLHGAVAALRRVVTPWHAASHLGPPGI